jgi:hypothetical protein
MPVILARYSKAARGLFEKLSSVQLKALIRRPQNRLVNGCHLFVNKMFGTEEDVRRKSFSKADVIAQGKADR